MNDARVVEAVLFASDGPLSPEEIARADEALDEDRVEAALVRLRTQYDESGRAFELRHVADGVQLMTRPEFAPYLERMDTVAQPARLSGPALEALAVVVYRQPISRTEIEGIRGVNSSGVIRTLLARELIHVAGRGDGIGRPVLYGTTPRFMEHFGLASLDDLPKPEELPVVLRDPAAAHVPVPGSGESDGEADDGAPELNPGQALDAVLAHAGDGAAVADAPRPDAGDGDAAGGASSAMPGAACVSAGPDS